MINIVQKGMLTTIQDLGRRGYQRSGVPVSGAMDPYAARLANILVGNPDNAPLLEVTVIGPVVEFERDGCFAVTGATFVPKLNGAPIEMNRCVFAPAGSRLEMGFASLGARGYLAFAGGLDVPLVMGSASTYMKAKLGGLDGGPLGNGDRVAIKAMPLPGNIPARMAPADMLPSYSAAPTVRIVAEARPEQLAADALDGLTAGDYTVQGDSDRMGCRLDGAPIPYAEGCDGNIISDGIALGSIQIAGGKPIILMADRQTTGGYTRIGAVIGADIPLVAQLKPAEKLRFVVVSLSEAQAALRAQHATLRTLAERLG